MSICLADFEEEDYEEGEGEEEEPEVGTEKVPRSEENIVGPQPENKEEQVEEHSQPEVKENVEVHSTTSAPIIDLCELNNGGCDHNCHFHREDGPSGRVECSCFAGFTLNAADGRSCQGESHSYLESDSQEPKSFPLMAYQSLLFSQSDDYSVDFLTTTFSSFSTCFSPPR